MICIFAVELVFGLAGLDEGVVALSLVSGYSKKLVADNKFSEHSIECNAIA